MENESHNNLIKLECSTCKSFFSRAKKFVNFSMRKNQPQVFCSHMCANEFSRSPRIDYPCLECGKMVKRIESKTNHIFCSHSCSAKHSNKSRRRLRIKPIKPVKIIKPIKPKPPIQILCICQCKQCNVEVLRTKRNLDPGKNKNGNVFCSRSCRMTYQNLNTKLKYGCRKSKAEVFLSCLIKSKYPNLLLLENDRTTLPSKLEIDIYIPSINLAIEVNGPIHYFPIFGEERLKKCQNKDNQKSGEMLSLKISLLSIDISKFSAKKKVELFLKEHFQTEIVPIIDELITFVNVEKCEQIENCSG